MDELLEIIMRDKAWSDEKARKTYVAILEVMTKPQPKAVAKAAAPAMRPSWRSPARSRCPPPTR